MPTYIVTGPDGSEYEITGPGTEQEALAEAQRRAGGAPSIANADAQDAQHRQHNIDIVNEVRDKPWYGRLGQTLADQAMVGASGLTFGFTGGPNTEDAKTRLASTYVNGPYEGHGGEAGPATLEALTSLVGPARAMKVWEELAGGGKLARGVVSTGVGAGTGALSAAGHGKDPVTGAIVGGAGGALVPIGAATIAPALRWGGATGGATLGGSAGGSVGIPGLGYLGGMAGNWLGRNAGNVVNAGLDTAAGRSALAAISMLPATQGYRVANPVDAARDNFAKLRAGRSQ